MVSKIKKSEKRVLSRLNMVLEGLDISQEQVYKLIFFFFPFFQMCAYFQVYLISDESLTIE